MTELPKPQPPQRLSLDTLDTKSVLLPAHAHGGGGDVGGLALFESRQRVGYFFRPTHSPRHGLFNLPGYLHFFNRGRHERKRDRSTPPIPSCPCLASPRHAQPCLAIPRLAMPGRCYF